VAIYSVSGWTDDLFPPVEAFRQFSLPTICPGNTSTETGPIQDLTGRTPQALANGTLAVNYATPDTLLNRKPPRHGWCCRPARQPT
jgi:hypothetical protein